MKDQLRMENAELRAKIERQQQYILAYQALMEYWKKQSKKQSFDANSMLGQICDILK